MAFFSEKAPARCIPAPNYDEDSTRKTDFARKAQAMENIHSALALQEPAIRLRGKERCYLRNPGYGTVKVWPVGDKIDRMGDYGEFAKIGNRALRQCGGRA
jgi:hypothetical protein